MGSKKPSVRFSRIADWSPDDRPRERLQRHGADVLSDAELLAILISSGTRNLTAVDVGKELLREFGPLAHLARRNYRELSRGRGMGSVKAMKLAAAFEIARRIEAHRDEPRSRVTSPEDIVRRFLPQLRDLKKEVFLVVLLDSAHRIIREAEISRGTLNASLVHPREVFKAALDDHAASVILLHNHPSGNPEPSAEDVTITEQLRQAGKIMGIPVLDHIIVAGQRHTSLAQLGYF
jgi:DNA repair protein RadC